jgi:hypothetical protein
MLVAARVQMVRGGKVLSLWRLVCSKKRLKVGDGLITLQGSAECLLVAHRGLTALWVGGCSTRACSVVVGGLALGGGSTVPKIQQVCMELHCVEGDQCEYVRSSHVLSMCRSSHP